MNKIFLPLRGIPAIVRSVAPFSGICAGAVVVARQEEQEEMTELLAQYGLSRFVKTVAVGGDTRQASVKNGLDALPKDAEIVLIHDGARALITEEVITRALASAEERGCGVAAVPVTDTVKRAEADGRVLETLNREELYAMQTPQAFQVPLIRSAHERAKKDGYLATDDAALLEYAGLPVYLTAGDRENIKLTTPADLAFGEAILTLRREREAMQ
ncbi:MAG: 2-C-methyl-D-erythritol 4-phosphate cytidylyltransferase [Eubacteriales bacterium]|nr:2-C-methyl-D-erythritol 4-phosphate cytidylyltransferase [Eubacteriales bacterium]